MKKIVAMVLALVLLVGGAAAAAELSISRDLHSQTEIRGVVKGLYGELGLNNSGQVKSLNMGVKAQTEQPFYGVAQLNFTSDDPGDDPYTYSNVEFGGGVEFKALWDVNVGLEATVKNPDVFDFGAYEPNLTAWVGADFNIFPDPTI